jgi:predicted nucleotidyltransferase
VPLVTRIVAVIDVLPCDEQVAPVIPPPPLDEDELLVLELEVELEEVELELVELLVLELDEPVFEYEQYRGLPPLKDGNNDAEQVIGPVNVAYTNEPDLP